MTSDDDHIEDEILDIHKEICSLIARRLCEGTSPAVIATSFAFALKTTAEAGAEGRLIGAMVVNTLKKEGLL